MSPAELNGMPTSTPVALAHDKMDEQSKNEMVDFFWMEYIRLNIDVDKRRTQHWSPTGFYDIPIGSISGVKLNMFRLRFNENEMAVFFTLKNADNKNIFHLTDCGEHDLIKHDKDKDTERFTKVRIREGVDKLIVFISSLDFNVRTGILTQRYIPNLPVCFKKLASLGKAKCIEDTECCVCLEPTITHFKPCNHHICGVCVSNLNKMICPMCRADYQYDSDEE
jgi:hypothetical protein